jgi:dTDP-4-dehydrorhamnose reductase
MRVLLLGKHGQVGWELQRVLASCAETIAPARAELDLGRPQELRDAVRAARPDVIVNAAAYTAVDLAEDDPAAAFATNAEAVGVLAAQAAALGAGLVHYSTDYVFDGSKSGPYAEEDATNPLGVYGRSKRAGELAIQAAGCAHLILRTSWVYGVRNGNFLLTMLRLANTTPQLRVVADQFGVPTWSRMVAEVTGHLLVALRGRLADDSGIYHLCSSGHTTWHGFAEQIVALGAVRSLCRNVPVVPITTAEYPTKTRRPPNSILATDKLAKRFGLRLPDWQDCLHWCLDDLVAGTLKS